MSLLVSCMSVFLVIESLTTDCCLLSMFRKLMSEQAIYLLSVSSDLNLVSSEFLIEELCTASLLAKIF